MTKIENKTTDDKSKKTKYRKGKHKYPGTAKDGLIAGSTVNPGNDEADELRKLLKGMVVHTSNESTLKLASIIIKTREDIPESKFDIEEPDPNEYLQRVEVLLTDSKGKPKFGVDGKNIVVEELHVFDSDKKERLWCEYDRMRKRSIYKVDELNEAKMGALYQIEGQIEPTVLHRVENAKHKETCEEYKALFKTSLQPTKMYSNHGTSMRGYQQWTT